ncbi:alpha-galactosidase [Jeotgalibaca caeni]|uniref:alpha-galactosidase n=1 Tax=Jeotgalibaca caeni TaxID=3028623 RepID=UPI003B835E4A
MIYVNEKEQTFHLTNGKISYIFRVMERTNILEQLYYGKAIRIQDSSVYLIERDAHPFNTQFEGNHPSIKEQGEQEISVYGKGDFSDSPMEENHYKQDDIPQFAYLIEREVRPSNNQFEGDYTSSLEHVKQEMPVYGTTDFRYPALEVKYSDGAQISQFEYVDYTIQKGKTVEKGLPSTFAKEEEAETLVIQLKDRYSELNLQLFYTIFKNQSVIVRSSRMENTGTEALSIEQLMSMNVDFPDADYEMIHLHGAWARETHVQRNPLLTGVQHVSSTRGASSHVHNPFLGLVRPETTEAQGEAFGFSLIYSGNFLAQVEVDSYQVTRVMLGINPFQFSWNLTAGESFQTPEAVMVFSDQGMNGMSQAFHSFYLNHLINPRWAKEPRPILINNWEATYFNFTEEKIMEIVREAQNLGVELFVLDDGWFGQRDDDSTSLGNWTVDERKLPNGIQNLVRKVHEEGMKLGLWFEPEMISKGTPLYEAHPEWVIGDPKKRISHGRNQFILDFSRPAVVEAIFQQMDAILEGSGIDYVKWDMNRYISEAFSSNLPKEQQGELFHRYILGVYDLYEKILAKYPDLLIESCAGGGGRFDPGLLYYAPQTWASDDTDAVERLKIQYGASLVYPLSSIGAHVSAVPNHQVGRVTSLKMRGDVARFGTFGYELDPTQLTEDEKIEIREQISQVKEQQQLLLQGDFYRLKSPFEGNDTAWMVVSKDKKEALVGYYRILAGPNPPYKRIKLQGLAEDKAYHIGGITRYGNDLMNVGILLSKNFTGRAHEYWAQKKEGDFFSLLYHLKADE